MSKSYVSVLFRVDDIIKREVLNYHLEENGVSSIEELDDAEIAYFEVPIWEECQREVVQLASEMNIDVSVKAVENQNWNALWEAGFQPVLIDDFCLVRAPFHPPSGNPDHLDIILEPRMAFGTAHHATTYMMMQQMNKLNFKDKKVLDFGCGTAILSILAEKLEAATILAIDNDENAVENADYNAKINGCTKIAIEQNILENIPFSHFDIILANINRQVLLDSAFLLNKFLAEEGNLLISGILEQDLEVILPAFGQNGLKPVEQIKREDWMCLHFRKSQD